MTMTVEELIEALSGLPPETEVRFAHQPSWPFEYSISDLHVAYPSDSEDDDDGEPLDRPGEVVAYLVEEQQLNYLPGAVSRAIGWK